MMNSPTSSKDHLPTIVFLDRDGTLGPDVGYCSRPEDFNLYHEAPEAVRLLNERSFKVAVVTNQSAIARGYLDKPTLALIHDKMTAELREHGATVDAIAYCPHHPDDGCGCRKPRPGMFRTVLDELGLERVNAYMIGDNASDIGAGKALGAGTVFICTDAAKELQLVETPDHTAPTLLEAVRWVIEDAEPVKHPVERQNIPEA